jgi:hypothetical protein
MGRIHTWLAIAVVIGAITAAMGTDSGGQKPVCGRYGTTVEFVPTPTEAATQAKREEKLVLILHVSGHFETPEFT